MSIPLLQYVAQRATPDEASAILESSGVEFLSGGQWYRFTGGRLRDLEGGDAFGVALSNITGIRIPEAQGEIVAHETLHSQAQVGSGEVISTRMTGKPGVSITVPNDEVGVGSHGAGVAAAAASAGGIIQNSAGGVQAARGEPLRKIPSEQEQRLAQEQQRVQEQQRAQEQQRTQELKQASQGGSQNQSSGIVQAQNQGQPQK